MLWLFDPERRVNEVFVFPLQKPRAPAFGVMSSPFCASHAFVFFCGGGPRTQGATKEHEGVLLPLSTRKEFKKELRAHEKIKAAMKAAGEWAAAALDVAWSRCPFTRRQLAPTCMPPPPPSLSCFISLSSHPTATKTTTFIPT